MSRSLLLEGTDSYCVEAWQLQKLFAAGSDVGVTGEPLCSLPSEGTKRQLPTTQENTVIGI